MTVEQAVKKHPGKSAVELWESEKEFQKTPFPEFARKWHEARVASLKPQKANTTGHSDIDSKSPEKPSEAPAVEPGK